jgi:hypothetical protein
MSRLLATVVGCGLLIVSSTAYVGATGRAARYQIALRPYGGSHVSGTATIAYDAAHHTTTVTLYLRGFSAGIHFAHIHIGRCGGNGDVRYALEPMRAGRAGTATSVTSIPYHLNGSALHINVHGIPSQPMKIVACGNL